MNYIINKRYNEGETVDETSLFNKRLIQGSKKGGTVKATYPVKILGDGNLSKKLIFKIKNISAPAREKISKIGAEIVKSSETTASAEADKSAE